MLILVVFVRLSNEAKAATWQPQCAPFELVKAMRREEKAFPVSGNSQ